jgi:hypothetical protein
MSPTDLQQSLLDIQLVGRTADQPSRLSTLHLLRQSCKSLLIVQTSHSVLISLTRLFTKRLISLTMTKENSALAQHSAASSFRSKLV